MAPPKFRGYGLAGFQTMIVSHEINQAKTATGSQNDFWDMHYRFLSQRSCRLSRDRCQLRWRHDSNFTDFWTYSTPKEATILEILCGVLVDATSWVLQHLFKGIVLSGPVRDTPPYRAIPFRDSIAEGGIAPICLVFIGYRASIAEIPLLRGGGYRTSTSHALQGGNAQERVRGYRTQLAMLRHQKPHTAQ